ncbi:hypothetical protein ABK040_010341 [Willaertia magna]
MKRIPSVFCNKLCKVNSKGLQSFATISEFEHHTNLTLTTVEEEIDSTVSVDNNNFLSCNNNLNKLINDSPIPKKGSSGKLKKKSKNVKTVKSIIPPQRAELLGRKTVVLDLDETLIKSFYTEPSSYDFIINIEFPGREGEMIHQSIWIKKRPHLTEFLELLSSKFELLVFTAALPSYANAIIENIDPESKYFSSVLYRHHCNMNDGTYVYGKNLNLLGRDLLKTIIIDDGVLNFHLNPNNGMLIKRFVGDEDDRVLLDVITPFLLRWHHSEEMSSFDLIQDYKEFFASILYSLHSEYMEEYKYYINCCNASVF